MFLHKELSQLQIKAGIRSGQIAFAGNRSLKIYGKLSCSSGKRMKQENRVFFKSEKEAITNGYRPCGHCQRLKHKVWIGK